jgi:hypothetical protein
VTSLPELSACAQQTQPPSGPLAPWGPSRFRASIRTSFAKRAKRSPLVADLGRANAGPPVRAYGAAARPAWLVAFGSMLLGTMTWWRYFSALELPAGVRSLAFVVPSVVFACGVLISRRFVMRGPRVPAAVALPATWVSFEHVVSLGRNGTALRVGYTQMDFLPTRRRVRRRWPIGAGLR